MTDNATTPAFSPPAAAFRALVLQAFTEVLPAMGCRLRDAQYEYASHVTNEMLMAPRQTAPQANVKGSRANLGLIEGPPGIGKTLGYLVVAALWSALAHKAGAVQRVLVSTHTLVLQNQIVGRFLASGAQPSWGGGDDSDIAIAIEVARRLTGVTLTAAYRKGRQAYVDADKARSVLAKLSDDSKAQDMLAWINTFPVLPDEDALEAEHVSFRAALESDPRQGLLQAWLDDGHDLPDGLTVSELVMSSGSDPSMNPWYGAARDNAFDADIVVVTHAMVLVDIVTNGRVLAEEGVAGPAQDFALIIHDEADMLPGVAESFSRHKIRPITLRHLLDKSKTLFDRPVDTDAIGSQIVAARDALLGPLTRAEDFLASVYNEKTAYGLFREGRAKEHPLTPTDDLAKVAADHAMKIAQSAQALAKVLSTNRDAMRRKAKRLAGALAEALNEAGSNLALFARLLTLEKDQKKNHKNPGPEDVEVNDTADNRMAALSWSPKRALASFEVLRIDPGRMFASNWMFASTHRYVLLTSATLRVPSGGKSNEWSYIQGALNAYAAVNPRAYAPREFGMIDRVCLAAMPDDGTGARGPFLRVDDSNNGDSEDEGAVYNPRWQALALFGIRQMAKTGEPGLLLTPSYRDVEWMVESLGHNATFWFHRRGVSLRDGIKALQDGTARILVTPAAWAGHNIRALGGTQMLRHIGILRLPYPPRDTSLLACLEAMKRRRSEEDPDRKASGILHIRMRALAMHKFIQGVGRGIRATDDVMTLWVFDPRFGVDKKVIGCGDPVLSTTGIKAASDNGMWHQTLPRRFGDVLGDPKRVTLFVSLAQPDGTFREKTITPKPGIPINDYIV